MYDVFLSHNSKVKAAVQELARRLPTIAPPTAPTSAGTQPTNDRPDRRLARPSRSPYTAPRRLVRGP